MFQKIKRFCITALHFLLNPRFVLCFGLGWIITNGWSYIMLGFGTYFEIEWMIAVSVAYLTFLWLPVSPEKIVTFAIAIFLMKLLFPKDEKTLGTLKKGYEKAKSILKKKKEKHKAKKAKKTGKKTYKPRKIRKLRKRRLRIKKS